MWNTIQLALLPLVQDAAGTATEYGGVQGIDLSRYVTICVVLILAIGGVAWGFKRLVAGNLKARANKRSLQILDVLPLGGKQRLAVVRCYDRTFALGLGDKEVTAIAELDPVVGDEHRADDAHAAAAPEGHDDLTFQRALAHVQRALAKTRSGVGAAKPLRSKARRSTVAQLLSAASDAQPESAARSEVATMAPAAPVEPSTQTSPARAQVAELVERAAERSGPRREGAGPKTASTQSARPKARRKATAAKRKPANADAPRPAQRDTGRPATAAPNVPTLGLEGVMG